MARLQLRSFGLVAGVKVDEADLRRLVDEAQQPARRQHTDKSFENQRCATLRTLRRDAQTLLDSAKRRSQTKGRAFELDIDFVLDLILEQRARCAYSGVSLELLIPHSDWRRSLERLDNKQGYLRHNVVLIAQEFNSSEHLSPKEVVKGSSKWSKEKVERLPVERQLNVDLQGLHQQIDLAMSSSRIKCSDESRATFDKEIPTSDACLRCARCGCLKATSEFGSSRAARPRFQSYCRQCSLEYRSAWGKTLRGFSLNMISFARRRHKRDKWHGDFEINIADVLGMLRAQQGRCFYSDVPLRYAQHNVDWQMSLERLDSTKTYTKDNTRLVALEFNTPAQWSRRKVEFVWGKNAS